MINRKKSDVLIVCSSLFSKGTYTHTNNFVESIAVREHTNHKRILENCLIDILRHILHFISNEYNLVDNHVEHNFITISISFMVCVRILLYKTSQKWRFQYPRHVSNQTIIYTKEIKVM